MANRPIPTATAAWPVPEKTTSPPIWVNRPTKPPVALLTTTPPPQVTQSVNPDRFGESDFECGNPDYQAPISTALIVGGRVANRGQFPW